MSWIIEQRHVSKMGEERWLKVAGPFDDEQAAVRHAKRIGTGVMLRVVPG